jgi:hypothetical protein
VNLKNKLVDEDIKEGLKNICPDFLLDREHEQISGKIIDMIEKGETENIEECVLEAANLRSFLG